MGESHRELWKAAQGVYVYNLPGKSRLKAWPRDQTCIRGMLRRTHGYPSLQTCRPSGTGPRCQQEAGHIESAASTGCRTHRLLPGCAREVLTVCIAPPPRVVLKRQGLFLKHRAPLSGCLLSACPRYRCAYERRASVRSPWKDSVSEFHVYDKHLVQNEPGSSIRQQYQKEALPKRFFREVASGTCPQFY